MRSLMKNAVRSIPFAVLIIFISLTGHAETGVGHGGGGEWNVITCDGASQSGAKINVSVCLTGDTEENGKYGIIPCGSDDINYVTIERRTAIEAGSEMRETVKVPGQLFDVDWQKTRFSIRMNDSTAGFFHLQRIGETRNGASLDMNLPSMKMSLKNVSCEFGSN